MLRPSLTSSYDSKLPRQDLIYLDANNLYGHAISQYLPTGDFRILYDEEAQDLDLETLDDKEIDGYINEFDLHYPASLLYNHDDYPLAPELLTDPCTLQHSKQSFQNLFRKGN